MEKNFERLDMVGNCVANFLTASIVSTTEEVWAASLDTNLRAPFFCAQAAAPFLRRTRGTIINFADTGGLLRVPGDIAHPVSERRVWLAPKCAHKPTPTDVTVIPHP